MNDPTIIQEKTIEMKTEGGEVFTVYVKALDKPIHLNREKKMMCDLFVKTMNLNECRKIMMKELGGEITVEQMKVWMGYEEVGAYLKERFEDAGFTNSWTKEKWFGVVSRHIYNGQKIGELEARVEMVGESDAQLTSQMRLEIANLKRDRLTNGDLYAMNLIGKFKGWEVQDGLNSISVINFTQSDGSR